MNQNTWISWITTGIGLFVPLGVTVGLISPSTSAMIISAAGTLVPILWGGFIHSNTRVVQTAAAIPGVKPIEITSNAAPELQKIAMDPTTPTVVVAPPSFTSSPQTKRSF